MRLLVLTNDNTSSTLLLILLLTTLVIATTATNFSISSRGSGDGFASCGCVETRGRVRCFQDDGAINSLSTINWLVA